MPPLGMPRAACARTSPSRKPCAGSHSGFVTGRGLSGCRGVENANFNRLRCNRQGICANGVTCSFEMHGCAMTALKPPTGYLALAANA